VAREPVLACDPQKHPRRVYEREAKQPGLKGSDTAAAQPSRTWSCRLPLRADSLVRRPMVPQRLSIVVRRPPRNGFTDRVLGMPALRQLGFGPACQQLGSVDGWPLATPETEHREATTRCGHRNGRSSVLGPPPGAPKPHLPQRVRCGGRTPWGI